MCRFAFVAIFLLYCSALHAQRISFVRSSSDITPLTTTAAHRLERELTIAYPSVAINYAAEAKKGQTSARTVYYTLFHEGNEKYIAARFSSTFPETFSALALYEIRNGELIRLWHSRGAWANNYPISSLESEKAGSRTILLYRESGTAKSDFGTASLFSIVHWRAHTEGATSAKMETTLRDITPFMPNLFARSGLPFRTLLGQDIKLREELKTVVLSARDQRFSGPQEVAWTFDPRRNRFEREGSDQAVSMPHNY